MEGSAEVDHLSLRARKGAVFPDLTFLSYGPRGWLGTFSAEKHAVIAAIAHQLNDPAFRPTWVEEIVLGYDTVLVLTKETMPREKVESLFCQSRASKDQLSEPNVHVIPVTYDGEDLLEACEKLLLSPEEFVEQHRQATYRVRFMGFAPGFAYLDGLPADLALPRRDVPRPRMVPGAVAIGGSHAGIYPVASPGGWNWIGTTTHQLFDPQAAPPFLLQPGDEVRFLPQV